MPSSTQEHDQLLAKCIDVIGAEQDVFEGFLSSFKAQNYNQALRRLCTTSHTKALLLVRLLLAESRVFGLKIDEINSAGYSALDYAQQHNPEIHRVFIESFVAETTQVANAGTRQMSATFRGMPHRSQADQILEDALTELSGHQPQTPTPMPEDQRIRVNQVFEQVALQMRGLFEPQNLARMQHMTSEQRAEASRTFAQQMMVGIQPPMAPSVGGAVYSKPLIPVETLLQREAAFAPLLALYRSEQYAEALSWIVSYDKAKAFAVLPILEGMIRERPAVKTLLNQKDSRGQTPLHHAALAKNWLVYYSMGGAGANSGIMDSAGRTPADYRRHAQMQELRGESHPMDELMRSVFMPASPGPR